MKIKTIFIKICGKITPRGSTSIVCEPRMY